MVGGRQLKFDKQQALEEAMYVFWKKGFVGASLTDLTTAMSINKPSLYASFGNKEALFVSATEHYLKEHASSHISLLNQQDLSLNERLSDYLNSVLTMFCDPSKPGGCFVSVAANELAAESLPSKASKSIKDASVFTETYLITFFKDEKDKGNLNTKTEANELALMCLTFLHGLAAMARSGKSKEQIQDLIEIFVAGITR